MYQDIYFATAGKGICLGTTSNTDANTLDDYEEGTWTPTSVRWSKNETGSGANYTKIGNFVQLSWNQSITGAAYTGSGSGAAIGGLPFAVADCAVVSFSNCTLFTSSLGSMDNIGSSIFFRPNPFSSSGIANSGMFNGSGVVKMTMTYRTND